MAGVEHEAQGRGAHFQLKLSVGSGTEDMVMNPVMIIPVHFEYPTDRLADSPNGSRSLSQQTLDLEEMNRTCPSDTEFKLSHFGQ